MSKTTTDAERQRLERLERQMRENLKKRKALAKRKARVDVADANALLGTGDGEDSQDG